MISKRDIKFGNWVGRLSRGQRSAIVAALVVATGIPVVAVAAGATGGDTQQATASCVDNKSTNPDGCWTPPPGYVQAPTDRPFTPIPVPAYSSVVTAPGTITDQAQPPFSSTDYDVNNSWSNTSNGNYVSVYAGNIGGNASQGVVVVDTGPVGTVPGATGFSEKVYPTSTRDGSLTMVSSSGWTITLEATDGATYYFNAQTDAYVASAAG